MSAPPSISPWNNFVFFSTPECHASGDKRDAAIARTYMDLANGGGINSFLTNSYTLGAAEVLDALSSIVAAKAAEEFKFVLDTLGVDLPPCSQDERWKILEDTWTERLDEVDVLSAEADQEILRALQNHVLENEQFYEALDS